MTKQTLPNGNQEKEFLSLFKTLCSIRQPWEVWQDLISVFACTISNALDRNPERYEQREKEYLQCMERLGAAETVIHLFSILIIALENNPEQDFLGHIYMCLDLYNHWKGQYFTPYEISKMTAMITLTDDGNEQITNNGYLSILDPACGSGVMLIAAANELRARGINYQKYGVFVGQDIDRLAGMMCYVQLSLLGCPGYVVIADSLTNPVTGPVLSPTEKENQEFWYTPTFILPMRLL